MAAGRLGEEAFGRPLAALLRDEKVNGLGRPTLVTEWVAVGPDGGEPPHHDGLI